MKTVLGYIPKLPRGYWDNPAYYTVLSDDGLRSHAVLVKTDTKDWYWIYPILGSVKSDAQKEIAEVSDLELKGGYHVKQAPCGVEVDAKFEQIQRSIMLQIEDPTVPSKIDVGSDLDAQKSIESDAQVIESDTLTKS